MATAAMDYETADGERYDGKHAPRRPVPSPGHLMPRAAVPALANPNCFLASR